ncbi:ROK family protein [Staphylococcus aureus]
MNKKAKLDTQGQPFRIIKVRNFKRLLKSLSPYVKVKNDVNAALLGELKLHQYQAERIFGMTLGTGIGRTRIIGKVILIMVSFIRQNEVGYLLYRPTENTTFEQTRSTSALKKRMIDGGFTRSTHVPVLFEAAEEGDDIAKQILNEWAEDVAEGIAQIQVMYDPGLILIGGGISEQGRQSH